MSKIRQIRYNNSMGKNERILKFTEANLHLEGMHLDSDEKQKIMNCLTEKTSFDKEVKKLVTYYKEATI